MNVSVWVRVRIKFRVRVKGIAKNDRKVVRGMSQVAVEFRLCIATPKKRKKKRKKGPVSEVKYPQEWRSEGRHRRHRNKT